MLLRKVFIVALAMLLVAGCSAKNGTLVPTLQPAATRDAIQPRDVGPNLQSGRITYYPLGPSSAPEYLARAADGNIWVTDSLGSNGHAQYWKVTPRGATTKFTLPSGYNSDLSIASGPNKTVWFVALSTKGRADAAVKVATATGAATLYPLPGTNGFRPSLTEGADHNMWITNGYDSSIDRVTPNGVVTVFKTPTQGSTPTGITLGPDGNAWFIEHQAFAYITPSGTVVEFQSTSPLLSFAIITGSDGKLYAAGGQVTLIQLTTAGVESTYSCSNATFVNGLAEGPDHQIWLTLPDVQDTGGLIEVNTATGACSSPTTLAHGESAIGLAEGSDGDMWFAGQGDTPAVARYEEKLTTIGIRLNGEMSIMDPHYGFELGYAVGTGTRTQTIGLGAGESVQFKNLDSIPHSAAFLGDATATSALWPASFNGSTIQSIAGTAIGTPDFATGSLSPNSISPMYETGLPGFYMIGCQYHYNTNEMRTVIIVR